MPHASVASPPAPCHLQTRLQPYGTPPWHHGHEVDDPLCTCQQPDETQSEMSCSLGGMVSAAHHARSHPPLPQLPTSTPRNKRSTPLAHTAHQSHPSQLSKAHLVPGDPGRKPWSYGSGKGSLHRRIKGTTPVQRLRLPYHPRTGMVNSHLVSMASVIFPKEGSHTLARAQRTHLRVRGASRREIDEVSTTVYVQPAGMVTKSVVTPHLAHHTTTQPSRGPGSCLSKTTRRERRCIPRDGGVLTANLHVHS